MTKSPLQKTQRRYASSPIQTIRSISARGNIVVPDALTFLLNYACFYTILKLITYQTAIDFSGSANYTTIMVNT
jgi:hypothetical protein